MTETPHTPPVPQAGPAPLGFGSAPDPVDAAIERHRAAWGELGTATRAVDAAATAARQAEAEARADAAFDAASAAEGAAWADVIASRPADVPGAVRLLRYVSGSPASEVVEDPQDLLRQLTAAVEAAEAGERAGAGSATDETVPLDAEPDPVFAVVAEFRATWDAFGEAVAIAGGAAVPEAVEAAHDAVYARLRDVRPTTAAGFRTLAAVWAERLGDLSGETTIENAAASLIAGAGVCVPIGPDAPVSPALADLIARHADLRRQADAPETDDATAGALDAQAWALFRGACAFPVAGPADLAAKLALAGPEVTDSLERGRTAAAEHAWRCLRADLSRFGVLGVGAPVEPPVQTRAAEPVDWDDAPPGFMASPSHEPFGFTLIPHGLLVDLERLHGIALAEFKRKGGDDLPAERAGALRRKLSLPALEAAVDPTGRGAAVLAALPVRGTPAPEGSRMIAGGLHHEDGTVTSWDGTGEPVRRPVGRWIAFVLGQLSHRAQVEMDRRRQNYGDRSREEIEALEAEGLREVRFQALHVLTHHPDRAAAAAEFLRTTIVRAAPTTVVPDPVHTLIEAHRTAYAAWDRLAKVSGNLFQTDPAHAIAQAATDAAGEPEIAAYDALFAARPTTLAGASALAAYLVRAVAQARVDADPPDGERALGTIAAVLERLGTVRAITSAVGEPNWVDASALVEAIETEWAVYAAAEATDAGADEPMSDRRDALIDAADALPATSTAARHAKALALAWIVAVDRQGSATRGDTATDGRLAVDIHAALAGAPTAAHPDAALLAVEPELVALLAARERIHEQHRAAGAMLDACAGSAPERPTREAFADRIAYGEAMRRFDAEREVWGRTWERIAAHLGYRDMDGVYSAADLALLARARGLAEMPARTLAGLLLKARWVKDGADEELKDAIVADLLALGGGR